MYLTSVVSRDIGENDNISLDSTGEGEGSGLCAHLSLDQKVGRNILSSDYNIVC
jgi:hypothetical protein